MSEGLPITQAATSTAPQPVVNDFSITFGTVNGSGSQTANTTLLRALFRMGIPVSGKNIFPSNIQGQPTWYTIRVNKDGFLARRDDTQIVVAMNPMSFGKDLASLQPGGVFFYADDIKLPITRQDVIAYPMPVKKLSRESDVQPNLRDYIANMVYVGVVAHMLGIDLSKIYEALDFHFKSKKKAVDFELQRRQSSRRVGRVQPGETGSRSGSSRWMAPRDTSWPTATPRPRSGRFTGESSSPPGTRLPRPPAWPNR